MRQAFLTLLFCALLSISFSQNCSSINTQINAEYSYVNEFENLEIPFNKSWNISLENQKSIIVFLQSDDGNASAGIMKNKNGYRINSAHSISKDLVMQLINNLGSDLTNINLKDVKVRNLPVKQVEYNYKLYNLDETYLMSGLMYLFVKEGNTYVFMFNFKSDLKNCYVPFFKNVIKNTYYGPSWY